MPEVLKKTQLSRLQPLEIDLSMNAVNKTALVNPLIVEHVSVVSLTMSGSSCWHDSSWSATLLSGFSNPEIATMVNNDDGQQHRCKYF